MKNIEAKLDLLCEKVNSMDKQLAVYNQQLSEHMRRTNILEEEVKILAKTQQKLLGAFILAQVAIPVILKFIL